MTRGLPRLNEVLRARPEDPLGLAYRGQLRWHRVLMEGQQYRARAAVDSAATDLRLATEGAPGLAQAAVDYAWVLFTGYSEYVEADRYVQHAYSNDRYWANAPRILDRIARVRFELGQDSLATEGCTQVVRDYPDDPTGYSCLLEVMAWGVAPADPDTAWALDHRLVESNPEGLPRFGLAVAGVLAKAPGVPADSARSVMASMVGLAGDSARDNILPLQAAVLLRLNEMAQARALFDRFRQIDSIQARLLSSRRALRGLANADPLASPR